jgi:DNA-binding response OmpR family regulator
MAATERVRAVPRILVVDDDRDIRETLAEAMAHAGYLVNAAPDGKVALEQARLNLPNLILLDLMMPVMSGWDFLMARRGVPALASVPVVVVSAAFDREVDGAAMVLQKPFDLSGLLAIVARLCAAHGESCSTAAVSAAP